MQHGRPFLAKSQNVTNKHTRRTAYKFHLFAFPLFPFLLRSTHRTVLLNLILFLIRVRRDFFISVASSLLQIEMDYSDGRFSFRSLYFPTALLHTDTGEKGFQTDVMIILKDSPSNVAFQVSQESATAYRRVYDTPRQLSNHPFPNFLFYHANREVAGFYPLFYAANCVIPG